MFINVCSVPLNAVVAPASVSTLRQTTHLCLQNLRLGNSTVNVEQVSQQQPSSFLFDRHHRQFRGFKMIVFYFIFYYVCNGGGAVVSLTTPTPTPRQTNTTTIVTPMLGVPQQCARLTYRTQWEVSRKR